MGNYIFWRNKYVSLPLRNKRQQYIQFNKQQNNYTWEYRNKGFQNLEKRVDWLKA